MKRILIACTVMALAACTGKDENGDGIADGINTPDSISQVAPSTPVGSVSGQAVKLDGSPLDGVKVTLILGPKVVSANTSSNGTFSFKDIPAGGQVSMLFEKQGFATARAYGTVPSASGNFPINNGNLSVGQVGMAALTGTAQFRVITSEGVPASGATATVEFTSAAMQLAAGNATITGLFSATSTVGADGILKFENIPDFQSLSALSTYWTSSYMTLALSAWDDNADGFADWRGYYGSWSTQTFITQVPTPLITLQPANLPGGLSIAGASLASFTGGPYSPPFRNALKNNDPVSITFNQPINEVATARWVKVVAEDCKTDVPVTVTQVSPWTIQITPNSGWTLGAKYNFGVHVTGLDSGDSVTFVGYGFGLDATQAKAVSSVSFRTARPAATGAGAPYTVANGGAERMWAVFDVPVTQVGGANAVVQFGVDLGGATGLEDCGENANKYYQGFSISPDEPTSDNSGATNPPQSTFACLTSGYASAWLVSIPSGCVLTQATIPLTAQAKVAFPKSTSSGDAYQSITGADIQADLVDNDGITPVLLSP